MDKRQFASWEAFFSYMDTYQQRTNQVFSRRTATSVKTRNHVLTAIAVSGKPLPSPLLPESFLDYTRTLQCAHKSSDRAAPTHVRWDGVQPSECQARVTATLQRCADGRYRICVTNLNLVHNHPLPAVNTAPSAPPPNRTYTPVASSHAASSSVETQGIAKRRRVERTKYPLPSEPSAASAPSMADVRQFLLRVARVREQQPGLVQSVEERLASYVNEFAAQDGNVSKIFVDDQKVLSSITLQTKHMRKVFEAFPEVLRVDDTSSTEKGSSGSSYRVFSLMAHDTFGNWQYVQHAIVENGHSETLRAALNQFKTHNEQHKRIRALIVRDGDSPVLAELRGTFPSARVLYSQFHVLRSLHDAIYGIDLTSWHKDRLTGIAQTLVYAPTLLEYSNNISMMQDILGTKEHPLLAYFLKTWDSCRDRWTTFAREGVTTFSIAEGGDQFASTWQEVFNAANDEFALDETVAAIRYYQAIVERAFMRELHRAVTEADSTTTWRGANNTDEYDAEMRMLAATVSPAASSLIFPQYRHAASRARYQFCEPTRGSFFISAVAPNEAFSDETAKEFCVEAERGWQCSCAFMLNHHLPCRHIFYIRRIVRCSCVIPMESIEPRWILNEALRFFDAPQVGGQARGILHEAWKESELEDHERCNVIAQPGAWQKFVTAVEIGKRIGQRMMEMGPSEFDHALRFYKLVETTMNTRPFNVNSSVVAARINSDVRETAARVVFQPNSAGTISTTAQAPQTAAAGTVYGSTKDNLAAVRAMNMRLTQSITEPALVPPSVSSAQEVIDLADDDESEEDKEDKEEDTEQDGEPVSVDKVTGPVKEEVGSAEDDTGASGELEGGDNSPHSEYDDGDEEQENGSEEVEAEPNSEKESDTAQLPLSMSKSEDTSQDENEFTPEQVAEQSDEDSDLLHHLDRQV